MEDVSKVSVDLSAPQDDGACSHLQGIVLPEILLTSSSGEKIRVDKIVGKFILYCYPMTGRPDVQLPAGWADIPGAMGCTLEAGAFRDRHAELEEMGYGVYGLSAQSTSDQLESKLRLQLSFDLLSDLSLEFADALALPTFVVEGRRLIKRLTLVVHERKAVKVFYPVYPPEAHAEEVAHWIATSPA